MRIHGHTHCSVPENPLAKIRGSVPVHGYLADDVDADALQAGIDVVKREAGAGITDVEIYGCSRDVVVDELVGGM